jgi:hypothetical protein
MSKTFRRWSVWLLWFALATLPLRGWANATMHLPTFSTPLATESSSLPCHERAPSALHAAEPGTGCGLCDLCHAAALPADTPPLVRAKSSPPRVATLPELAVISRPSAFFRPPRG